MNKIGEEVYWRRLQKIFWKNASILAGIFSYGGNIYIFGIKYEIDILFYIWSNFWFLILVILEYLYQNYFVLFIYYYILIQSEISILG